MNKPAKTVNINGAEIPVLLNNRALVNYKRDAGRQSVIDLEDALRLAWHSVKAGAASIKLEFKMTFEEWIDYTDAHPEIMDVSTSSTTDDSTGSTTDDSTGSTTDSSNNAPDPEREAVEGVEGKKKATM